MSAIPLQDAIRRLISCVSVPYPPCESRFLFIISLVLIASFVRLFVVVFCPVYPLTLVKGAIN